MIVEEIIEKVTHIPVKKRKPRQNKSPLELKIEAQEHAIEEYIKQQEGRR